MAVHPVKGKYMWRDLERICAAIGVAPVIRNVAEALDARTGARPSVSRPSTAVLASPASASDSAASGSVVSTATVSRHAGEFPAPLLVRCFSVSLRDEMAGCHGSGR